MCEMAFCPTCGSECFVCSHCGRPFSVDGCIEDGAERFCSWECSDKFDKFQEESAKFIARRVKRNKKEEGMKNDDTA